MRSAIEEECLLTVRELEGDLGIPKTAVWRVLIQNLGLSLVWAKLTPKLLTATYKNHHFEITEDNDENVLKKNYY